MYLAIDFLSLLLKSQAAEAGVDRGHVPPKIFNEGDVPPPKKKKSEEEGK